MRVLLGVLSLVLLMSSDRAFADKRVALVIGNSTYQHTSKLANPKNDANDIAAALKKHGFHVVEGFDLNKQVFDRTVRDFATALRGAEAGVFFYAGHGLQVAGQNYLVPVDAKVEDAEALEFELVRVDVLHRIMERQTTTNVIFLDACRDNPLARNLARSLGTRSSDVGRGLAAFESGVGTLISFSTQPGNVALDGTGRNSPFAEALVKHMKSSKDDLSAILINVRNDVMKATQRKQVPWEHSALTGRFHFIPPQQIAAVSTDTKETKVTSATAATSLARGPSQFDGTWAATMICPKTPDGTLGFTRTFAARVENGEFLAEHGVKGQPLWLLVNGKIETDGKAVMKGQGLTGGSKYSLGSAKPGSLYTFDVTARFEGADGTGARLGSRPCDMTFAKQ